MKVFILLVVIFLISPFSRLDNIWLGVFLYLDALLVVFLFAVIVAGFFDDGKDVIHVEQGRKKAKKSLGKIDKYDWMINPNNPVYFQSPIYKNEEIKKANEYNSESLDKQIYREELAFRNYMERQDLEKKILDPD